MRKRFETFTVLINRISRSIRQIENLEMADYNLRSPHISCLYHLYLADGLTSVELCELCEEDKATISRSIGFLEKEGYLTCESKSSKRYKAPLYLTEKGISTGRRLSQRIDRVLEEVSVGLCEDERKNFYKSLSVISENLERIKNNLM